MIEINAKSLKHNGRPVLFAMMDQESIGIINIVYPDTQINLYGDGKALRPRAF